MARVVAVTLTMAAVVSGSSAAVVAREGNSFGNGECDCHGGGGYSGKGGCSNDGRVATATMAAALVGSGGGGNSGHCECVSAEVIGGSGGSGGGSFSFE